jgi:hypothetical protein
MIGVLVTFQYGNEFDEAKIQHVAETAQGRFKGMPGLRSKAFTIDATKRAAINFYIWIPRKPRERSLHRRSSNE